jgi:(E)-4-hydroxy-3-methylbut-2-enyl-diphosphate synthase
LSYNILQAAGRGSSRPIMSRALHVAARFQSANHDRADQSRDVASQGREDRHHGLHREWPGEMADADFGYVGGAPGKVNLYVGKTAVKFNIPEAEAVDRLQDLIREHGKWVDPVLENEQSAAGMGR